MKQPAHTHVAQLNVATALDDMDSPRLADFTAALDRVNAIAERSPGFVWRLTDADGNDATSIQTSDDPRFIVNLSVWETPGHLEHFVWNTAHKRVYDRKAEWFTRRETPHFVMWWVPAGHRPNPAEALGRLDDLTANGPSERAFGWESLPHITRWKDRRCA